MVATVLGQWRAREGRVRDGGFALALLLLSLIPGTGQVGAAIGDLPVHRWDASGFVLLGLLSMPLAVRRRRPGWCLALVGLGFAAYELVGYRPSLATLAVYAALYSAGAHLERGRGVLAAAATVGYVLLAVGLWQRGSPQRPADYLLFLVALVVSWAVGAWMRLRRRAEVARRTAEVADAAGHERARIARELHDIVTHHVTAMVVQADATQYLLPDGAERAGGGLIAISETGRRALADLRDLLTVLRSPAGEPTGERSPTLSQVAELIEQARAAGQPVEFIEEGTPRESSAGVELAAYRVAQESLTNAIKHAPRQRTVLRVGHLADAIRIEVTTGPGNGAARRTGEQSGLGLIGLAERVGLYGGELRAGTAADGTFLVRAIIPRSAEG